MQAYREQHSNNYFWRTWDGKELDWLEEREGKLVGYEFKYTQSKVKLPKSFLAAYPEAQIGIVHRENYLSFIGV